MNDIPNFNIPDEANLAILNAFALEYERERKAIEGAVLADLPITYDTGLLSQLHTPTFYEFELRKEDEPKNVDSVKEIFVEQKNNNDLKDQQDFESLLNTLTKPIQPQALQHSKEWYMAEITRLSNSILAQ